MSSCAEAPAPFIYQLRFYVRDPAGDFIRERIPVGAAPEDFAPYVTDVSVRIPFTDLTAHKTDVPILGARTIEEAFEGLGFTRASNAESIIGEAIEQNRAQQAAQAKRIILPGENGRMRPRP